MYDFFAVLTLFLMTHIICDFYLQPTQWVDAKKAFTYRSPALYCHSLLHGASLIIPVIILSIDWRSAVCLVTIVAITHFAIDLWKVTAQNGDRFSHFVIDQALHILVLTTIAFHMTASTQMAALLKHEHFSDAIKVLFGYLLILKPTSIVIGNILKKYPISSMEDDNNINGLVSAGKLIGYLERVLILTFTLVGSYAAVGFVLAAKSIFRFGELNKAANRNLTEYVFIGSLLSVVITTLVGTLLSLALKVKIA